MSTTLTEETTTPGFVQLYSIGHSDHCVTEFIELLRKHSIAIVVDVRSQPYSQWTPQFNRESLARDLQSAGFRYVFLGDALGGRPVNRAYYDPGEERPNYERLAQSPAFQAGIEQLLSLARTDRVAFMCSEGDHHRCHRTLLITPALLKCGAHVFHIRPDGLLVEAQPEAEQLSMF
jgi:uncharacterized protein (DUF488 family)